MYMVSVLQSEYCDKAVEISQEACQLLYVLYLWLLLLAVSLNIAANECLAFSIVFNLIAALCHVLNTYHNCNLVKK